MCGIVDYRLVSMISSMIYRRLSYATVIMQNVSMFKKLEKRYMHYKIKLMTIVHDYDVGKQVMNADKSKKSIDRIDRVNMCY